MGIGTVQLSKTVSHALRHEPWLYELELDDDGWVSVEAMLGADNGVRYPDGRMTLCRGIMYEHC